MSVNDDPAAVMCYRKKALPEDYAKTVAKRAAGLRAYQCPICHFWHITNDFEEDGTLKPGRVDPGVQRT